jgi:hypothetical protein
MVMRERAAESPIAPEVAERLRGCLYWLALDGAGVAGVGLVWASSKLALSPLQMALLLVGCHLVAVGLLHNIARLAPLSGHHCTVLAQALAGTIGGAFVLRTASTPLAAGMGWLLLAAAAARWSRAFLLLSTDIPTHLLVKRCQRYGQPLPLAPPMIYVLARQGLANDPAIQRLLKDVQSALGFRLAHHPAQLGSAAEAAPGFERAAEKGAGAMVRGIARLVAWLMRKPRPDSQDLAQFTEQYRSELIQHLYRLHGHRGAYFLSSDSFRITGMRPDDVPFHLWLLEQATAVVIVRGLGRPLAFKLMEEEACRRVPGPLYRINLAFPVPVAEPEPEGDAGDVLDFSVRARSGETLRAASILADRIAATNCAVKLSDARLPVHLRPLPLLVAKTAVPPLALTYLRFRCSKSDVERLLTLLDGLELMIKLSAIVLLAEQEVREPPLVAFLERPSLGQWVSALRSLSRRGSSAGTYSEIVSRFWQLPLREVPAKLIDDVRGSGLSWEGETPRSHLEWLDWLTWLRNITKGHGVVDNRLAAPLWHSFHAAFLDVVAGLQPITLETVLTVKDGSGREMAIAGCAASRLSRYFGTPSPAGEAGSAFVRMQAGDSSTLPLELFPFLAWFEDAVWVWNSVRGNRIEFIDYATGRLERVDIGGTDVVALRAHAR